MEPSLVAVFARWHAGEIARYEVNNAIYDVITEENVDAVVDSLPDWIRDETVESLRGWAEVDPSSIGTVEGGSYRSGSEDEEREWAAAKEKRLRDMRERFRRVTQPAARAWLARHEQQSR